MHAQQDVRQHCKCCQPCRNAGRSVSVPPAAGLRYGAKRRDVQTAMTAIDFAAFVDELASVSGETILPFFRTALGGREQGPPAASIRSPPPTAPAKRHARADPQALSRSRHRRRGIRRERADAEYVWVLDPIDGTKSFISGMPVWGTLIALMRFGEPVFGMMHQPFTRERFTGDGGAARYRGPAGDARTARARLRDARRRHAVHHQPAADERRPTARPSAVENAVRLSRYGGDCYAYCMLAAGHVDLVIETELKPYDIVAADSDHRRRRRHRHHLGERPAACRRPHRRRRRQARARRRRWRCSRVSIPPLSGVGFRRKILKKFFRP